MRSRLLVVALAFALPAAAAPAPPPSPSVDHILSTLQASSKDVTSLSGEFTQKNRIKLFKQELRSRGRLLFKPPRTIRWEYLDPDPSVLELDGNRATLTAPGAPPRVFDLEHDATMRTIFDQLLMWLQPGALERARADYDLTSSGTAEQPTLILVPKSTSPIAKAFQKIELRLDGKSWLIRGILLTEKNGDEKDITFPKLNRK